METRAAKSRRWMCAWRDGSGREGSEEDPDKGWGAGESLGTVPHLPVTVAVVKINTEANRKGLAPSRCSLPSSPPLPCWVTLTS